MVWIKRMSQAEGRRVYYYLAENKRMEDGSRHEVLLQRIPEEEIEFNDEGKMIWKKDPIRLKHLIFKKLIAIFIRQRVNTAELPSELDFDSTEAALLTEFIKSEVVPEYAEYF